MKNGRRPGFPGSGAIAIALVVGMALSLAGFLDRVVAATEEEADAPVLVPLDTGDRLPGVELAAGITEITGVAISPLLGVSTIGAWYYFRTPEESRTELPWFCHPVAWGIGFGILLMCALKDVIGTGAPVIVKKPLDVAELFENKLSAAVASVAFVPFVAEQISRHFAATHTPAEASALAAGGEGMLAMAPGTLAASVLASPWLLTPVLLAGFLVVWVVSHSVNVLILISPFGFIDAALKLFRLGVIAMVVTISAFQPVLGAIFCLILIGIAAMLAPWAFRLMVFGSVIAGDLARSLFKRSEKPSGRVFGFLAQAKGSVFPVRSRGWIECDEEGMLHFTRSSCLPRLKKSFRLAKAPGVDLRRGVLYPSLSRLDADGKPAKPMVILLPRYRPHMDEIAGMFGVPEIGESSLQRGIKGMLAWMKETVALGHSKTQEWIENAGNGGASAGSNSA